MGAGGRLEKVREIVAYETHRLTIDGEFCGYNMRKVRFVSE